MPRSGMAAYRLAGERSALWGILASAVQPSVSRSDASLKILCLLEIPSFGFRLKPFACPPAVDQNANAVQAFERSGILVNSFTDDSVVFSFKFEG